MRKKLRLPGNRIVKTAVAVFLTAFICQLIGWPPVFAVITAIVTLEPTVTDSIKKGIIRFPASAIGSFYAVLFISLFGNSALTYTLAAVLTILTCYQLKLHAGLLVATITAVAMIEVVYDHYWMSFFIRLGTTTIGLTVSTLVNMFIFPPNYRKTIEQNLKELYIDLGHALMDIHHPSKMNKANSRIKRKIKKTEQLIHYDIEDTHFRTFFERDEAEHTYLSDALHQLELIHYHINNLIPISINDTAFSTEHRQLIDRALTDTTTYMLGNQQIDLTKNEEALKMVMREFWRSQHGSETFQQSLLPNELIVLYELTSLLHIVNRNTVEKGRTA